MFVSIFIQKITLNRLIYVAKISPSCMDHRNITDHYEKLFYKMLKSHHGDTVSGLLLIYPSCVIHIIESSSQALYAILQDLAQLQNQDARSMLESSKVLVFSQKVPNRLFLQWYFRIINFPVVYLGSFIEEQAAASVLEDCLRLLLKLGVFLSQTLKLGSKGPGESLHDLAPQLLVREEVIRFLVTSDTLLTPEQFLAMYARPLNSPGDSDQVWPIPQHLHL
ncbi:testis-expressed protein 47-like [Spea bombifrons]|uniref:testis-expressed protein 47-like n=1 Tax=Spea bombifrons TaxID=233779 RepID=UPI002349811C|nr:testis-expressed protein 47-like [Spea bombifrons]